MEELYFDGAFGTYYYEKTNDDGCCENANLHSPHIVRQIHNEYIDAGCNAITTNTFAALRIAQGDKLEGLLSAGYRLACEAAVQSGRAVKVFCSIGGLDGDESEKCYLAAARSFIKLGAQNFIFETLPEYDDIVPALRLIREKVPDAFIIVSFAVSQDGTTRHGRYYKDLIKRAQADGIVSAAGLNCICGPSHMVSLAQALADEPLTIPLCFMPNSGYPSTLSGRMEYRATPDYFARKMVQIKRSGAFAVGGCCGTTPEHIRCTVSLIQQGVTVYTPKSYAVKNIAEPVFNPVRAALASGRKLIAVELDPPQDTDAAFLVDAAKALKAAGADVITVADSPLARARADSFVMAQKIKREALIETMPHLSCRDRNFIGLRGALIAGSIETLTNVLAVTGDSASHVTHAEKGVFSCTSFDLISMIATLNSTVLQGREYLVSCALNVNALNFEAELRRAERKKKCGAEVFFTQPIFTRQACDNFRKAKAELGAYIIAGVLPPAGYKNALFLSNEVPGVEIPQSVIDALNGKTPEEVFDISSDFAMDIINEVYEDADGFYLMTPLKKSALTARLTEKIRKKQNDSRDNEK
ncbi:MAG TPA: bifunctional homocysteine S-methyltransferase/methylenetetrahydrofolate reductase [Bacillota bacterium]|nr:bifunctional homocysteine S-methyltransferase/methylenetetrahydrofolate reductase [Bacillota bacterium]